MANPAVEVIEEDAADLQFPKGLSFSILSDLRILTQVRT